MYFYMEKRFYDLCLAFIIFCQSFQLIYLIFRLSDIKDKFPNRIKAHSICIIFDKLGRSLDKPGIYLLKMLLLAYCKLFGRFITERYIISNLIKYIASPY